MNYIKRVMLLLLGVSVLSLAASMLIIANLGSDAVTVLNQGVSEFLKLDIAYAVLINNAILFIIMLIFSRNKINIGTIVSAVLTGPIISLFLKILPDSFSNIWWINFIFSLIGLVIAAIGLSLYIYSNTGLGPFEGVVDALSKGLKLKFGYTKVIIDVIFFTIGSLLGGVVHVVSALSILIIGPLVNVFLYLLNKTNFVSVEAEVLTDQTNE